MILSYFPVQQELRALGLPHLLNWLSNHRLQSFRGGTVGVAKIDFMVLAAQRIALVEGVLVHSLDVRGFVGVGADVHELDT